MSRSNFAHGLWPQDCPSLLWMQVLVFSVLDLSSRICQSVVKVSGKEERGEADRREVLRPGSCTARAGGNGTAENIPFLERSMPMLRGPSQGPRGEMGLTPAQVPGRVLSVPSLSLALSLFKICRGVLEMMSMEER